MKDLFQSAFSAFERSIPIMIGFMILSIVGAVLMAPTLFLGSYGLPFTHWDLVSMGEIVECYPMVVFYKIGVPMFCISIVVFVIMSLVGMITEITWKYYYN